MYFLYKVRPDLVNYHYLDIAYLATVQGGRRHNHAG